MAKIVSKTPGYGPVIGTTLVILGIALVVAIICAFWSYSSQLPLNTPYSYPFPPF